MAIQKNFVVKNGIEVNDNLIFADKDQNTVGIGTTTTPEKLQVGGGIGATSIVVTGVGTFPTLKSTDALISNGYINVGIVTTLSGTISTYTTSNATTLNATTGNIISGVVTSITGTVLTYTSGNLGTLNVNNLYAVSGLTTNLTGTAATIGTVQIAAGIITSSSGIVTYYGDGSYLNLSSNSSTGIGIGTTGGIVGYGITFLDLKGAGVSTTFYDNSVGIATIFFEGGGGGGGGAIGIGSTFPGTPLSSELPPSNGDLFFHINYGRTFIYYDEVALGVGATAVWIDAAPFNQGISGALAGISFTTGSATEPSAYFEGYSTTGWFSPSPGQFGVVSVGNTILTVNPSGMVVTGIVSATDGFAGTFRGGIAVFEDTSTEPIVRISQAGTGNAFVVEDSINPDVSPFVITGIGSVGIGTNSPSAKLDVFGTIRAGRHDAVADGGEIILARSSNNDDGWAIDVHSDRFRITDIVQASSRFIISPGGNVGIGSDATSKLHVFGDAIVTGIATFGTSSVTIDGNANNIKVGSAVTVNSTGINVVGVISATSFVGNGSGLTGAGSTVSDDTSTNQTFYPLFTQTTSGTVTASKVSTSKLTFNPSTGTLTVVDINSTSDINLKTNINTVENALDTVSQLRGVSFDWKETGKGSYGVIAQEIEEVLPELVGSEEVKSVNYNGIIGVLIEAIKELKNEIEELKNDK